MTQRRHLCRGWERPQNFLAQVKAISATLETL